MAVTFMQMAEEAMSEVNGATRDFKIARAKSLRHARQERMLLEQQNFLKIWVLRMSLTWREAWKLGRPLGFLPAENYDSVIALLNDFLRSNAVLRASP